MLIFSNFWISHVMQHSDKFCNAFQLFSMHSFSSYLFRINYITFFPFLVSWRLWIKDSLKFFICYRRRCVLALVFLKCIFFEMIVYSIIIKESYFSSHKYFPSLYSPFKTHTSYLIYYAISYFSCSSNSPM